MKRLLIALFFWASCAMASDALQELLALFGIPQERAVAETQRLWLQKGKERWEFDDRFENMRPQLQPLFIRMGLFDEALPSSDRYDYAIVFGALLGRVLDRVHFLEELCQKKIRFGKIVFLTGDRPLLDSEKKIVNCENEAQMVRWVYNLSSLPKNVPAIFIDAPKNRGIRPQTADTIVQWLETGPLPGTCLAISNQPYVDYQKAVLRQLIPKEFSVEAAGPAAQGTPSVALLLDTIAKTLFWSDAE